MSVNSHRRHIIVIPEDDANRQIVTGFQLESVLAEPRQLHVDQNAGGWLAVVEAFRKNHLARMMTNPNRHVVLLLDFDGQGSKRLNQVLKEVPESVRSRVFVVGTRIEPEQLRTGLKSNLEAIGRDLAQACYQRAALADTVWQYFDDAEEVARMCETLRDFVS